MLVCSLDSSSTSPSSDEGSSSEPFTSPLLDFVGFETLPSAIGVGLSVVSLLFRSMIEVAGASCSEDDMAVDVLVCCSRVLIIRRSGFRGQMKEKEQLFI